MNTSSSDSHPDIAMDEHTWLETFRPIPSPRLAGVDNATWAIDYELDPHEAADYQFIAGTSPNRIWTIVETDVGDGEVILSGFHWVNRRAYW